MRTGLSVYACTYVLTHMRTTYAHVWGGTKGQSYSLRSAVFERVSLLLPSDLCAHQVSLPSTLLCLPPPHRSTGTAELGRHSQPFTGSGELSTSLCVPQQALLQA